MNSDLIIISDYCVKREVEPEFVLQLDQVGLIQIQVIDEQNYIHLSQVDRLERFVRWHYDLDVNAEGIDVISNLLDKIDTMQDEIRRLKQQIRLIETDF